MTLWKDLMWKLKTFTKCVVKCKHVQATVEVSRDILGSLLAFFISNERAIDYISTFTDTIEPGNWYGKRREPSKSKLIVLLVEKVALKDPKTNNSVKEIKEDATFVTDLIVAIRAMTNLPNTNEEFVWLFVSTLPKGFKWLDILADTYRTNSIKDGERNGRGSSQRIIIASSKSRLPPDFFEFLKNEENRTRVREIISEVFRNNVSKVLAKIETFNSVYFTRGCHVLHNLNWCHNKWGSTIESRRGGH